MHCNVQHNLYSVQHSNLDCLPILVLNHLDWQNDSSMFAHNCMGHVRKPASLLAHTEGLRSKAHAGVRQEQVCALRVLVYL